jgi:hypothetical protein
MTTKVQLLALGIAKAEGFGPLENFPTQIHNPGDLELGDMGWGVQSGKTVYPNDAAGWDALTHECQLMLTGESRVYNVSMTFLEVAGKYTGGDDPEGWARTVSQVCGMSLLNTLEEFLDAPNSPAPANPAT